MEISTGVTIDVQAFVDKLSFQDKNELLESLIISHDQLMELARKRLAEDFVHSWSSKDPEHQLAFLVDVENKFALGSKWSVLNDLLKLSRNISTHQHIYWKMFHDGIHGQFFQDWMEKNNIKSNYCDEFEDHQKLTNLIEMSLKMMCKDSIEQMVRVKRGEVPHPTGKSDAI